MSVSETSRNAWVTIRDSELLGLRQRQAAWCVLALGGKAAAFEVEAKFRERSSEHLQLSQTVMAKRLPELVRVGVLRIAEGETRVNPKTGQPCQVFEVTGKPPVPPKPEPAPSDHAAHYHDVSACHHCSVIFAKGVERGRELEARERSSQKELF